MLTLAAGKSVQILEPYKLGRMVEVIVVSDEPTDYVRVAGVKRDLDESISTGIPIVAGSSREMFVSANHELFAVSDGTPTIAVVTLQSVLADIGGAVIVI